LQENNDRKSLLSIDLCILQKAFDVKGKEIFSPGPDGRVGTKDDVSLPINPAVLGWDDGDE
jgi:hypothetical protein